MNPPDRRYLTLDNDAPLPDGSVGVDGYSRYLVRDGYRVAIEPYPFARPFSARLVARWSVAQWHVAVVRQYGWRGWFHLRRF